MEKYSKKNKKFIDRYFLYGTKRRYSSNELETEALIRDLYGTQKAKKFIEKNQKNSESIAKLLKNFTFLKESKELIQIKTQWAKIIPPMLKKLALPIQYENHILSIKCSNSHVRDILKKNYSKIILIKVKKILPKTISINFT